MTKIRMEIEVDVTPWTAERLVEEAGFDPEDATEDDDVPAHDIAEGLVSVLGWDETKAEALAGSALFYDIGDLTLISAFTVEN